MKSQKECLQEKERMIENLNSAIGGTVTKSETSSR